MSEEPQPKTFSIEKLKFEKSVAYQVGTVKKNINFSVSSDIYDERAIGLAKDACVRIVNRFIDEEMKDDGKIVSTPEFDIKVEEIEWKNAIGPKGPFLITSDQGVETEKLRDWLSEHYGTFSAGGYNYWLLPDKIAIGRRKVV
jgi:hypothetical protein